MSDVTTSLPADQERKAPGRPRSARADEAIIEAVLDLLADGTPAESLSIEAVAAKAGVGKATIYRRWANKEALLVDAVASLKGELPRLAGESGAGLITVAPDPELIEAYRAAGGTGPTYGQVGLSWAPDEQQARQDQARAPQDAPESVGIRLGTSHDRELPGIPRVGRHISRVAPPHVTAAAAHGRAGR